MHTQCTRAGEGSRLSLPLCPTTPLALLPPPTLLGGSTGLCLYGFTVTVQQAMPAMTEPLGTRTVQCPSRLSISSVLR